MPISTCYALKGDHGGCHLVAAGHCLSNNHHMNIRNNSSQEFRNAIFAGGGSRCFWQIGFWDGAIASGIQLGESVQFVGSTSAGCAMATAAALGRTAEALTLFKEMTRVNPGNIHWNNLFSAGSLLPHLKMYRSALETFVGAAEFETLKTKSVRFLMADYPSILGGALGAIVGFVLYSTEKMMNGPIHPTWARQFGFQPVIGDIVGCRDAADFINMALAASCVPPVLPGGRHGGKPVLDGGLVDNVPLLLADDQPGNTLVLLSQRYARALPQSASVTYVQPSAPIIINKFDYANPQGLQVTYDLGFADGRRFAAERAAQS